MNWTRADIKQQAKSELKISYFVSFMVCLLGGFLGAQGVGYAFFASNLSSSASSSSTSSMARGYRSFYWNSTTDNWFASNPMYGWLFLFIMNIIIIAMIAAALYKIFVANPLSVGLSNFFISAPRQNRDFSVLFSSFKSGRYLSSVGTMFLRNLFISLWGLLFVIPGVYKYYQWRMVPFIIADNPTLSPKEARDLSARMTQDEKLNIFLLDLSFIGWCLLGLMAFGIGIWFVRPYIEATFAQLYYRLKAKVETAPPLS